MGIYTQNILPLRVGGVDPNPNSISFASIGIMGSASLRNDGPNTVFVSFDAVPPSAAVQAGVIRIPVNDTYKVKDTAFTTIGGIVAAGSAVVQVVATQNPDITGLGI